MKFSKFWFSGSFVYDLFRFEPVQIGFKLQGWGWYLEGLPLGKVLKRIRFLFLLFLFFLTSFLFFQTLLFLFSLLKPTLKSAYAKLSSPAYIYSTSRIGYQYSGNRVIFDFPNTSKSINLGNRVMEWYPAPPTLQIKIRSVISPTSDFDKVHQLPFAKHEYLKIFVKIIYSRGVNKFCKNYKNNLAKNYKKSI